MHAKGGDKRCFGADRGNRKNRSLRKHRSDAKTARWLDEERGCVTPLAKRLVLDKSHSLLI
jgi:hypothetical protein